MVIQLLLLSCDPGMAAAARMQQCLAVFFKAYAAQSARAHRHLSAAALPAARRALSIGPSLAKSAAPHLLRFVSNLLQVGTGMRPDCFVLIRLCTDSADQTGLSHLSTEEVNLQLSLRRLAVLQRDHANRAGTHLGDLHFQAVGAGGSGYGRCREWITCSSCCRGGSQGGAGLPSWQCYKEFTSRVAQAGSWPESAGSLSGAFTSASRRTVNITRCAVCTYLAVRMLSSHTGPGRPCCFCMAALQMTDMVAVLTMLRYACRRM